MHLMPMEHAPKEGEIVIFTAGAAHRAEWDAAFSNFWSLTADRAMTEDECLCWLPVQEWRRLAMNAEVASKIEGGKDT